jgi:hypothetical protein
MPQRKKRPVAYVYGTLQVTGKRILLPEPLLVTLGTMWSALLGSSTWGQLIEQMPPAEGRRLLDARMEQLAWRHEGEGECSFDPDAPLDLEELPGYTEGCYPGWLEGFMLSELAEPIRKRFGGPCFSYGSGPGHSFDEDDGSLEGAVEALRSLGHEVRHDDELIRSASPLE